jgi:outer membrane protein assembly factor BamB
MIVPISSTRLVVGIAALLIMAGVSLLPPRADTNEARPNPQDQAERSWPMFGGSPGRNMVNAFEQEIPADWCVEEGKQTNIKWMAQLGNKTIGSPVVARGKVFVATDNAKPRDPNVLGPKAVLMAFRESDGQFLWQIAHEVPEHWGTNSTGALLSTPAVVGGYLHYVTSAGEVICADADDGKIIWRYNMVKELQVYPYREWACGARVAPPWSSPLVIGNRVFVATGNGVNDERELVSPGAPSFIALYKRTGKLAWQSNLPGENISEGVWSSPAYADHGGTPQVIFAGGDGVIYSFAPETGQLLWKCDCLPTRKKRTAQNVNNQFVATPVVVGDKLYVGLGVPSWHPQSPRCSYFLCLDITRKGDVSLKSYDAKDAANKGSALVWAFGGRLEPRPEKGRRSHFGPTVSTAAVHQGLVYITEEYGHLHCFEAATGNRLWVYDLKAMLIGSPFLVKDRVYVGNEDGEIVIFAHDRAARVVATIDMEESIVTTPVAVNGTLYITTPSKLFAIGAR